jgi:hypothetical protein
VALEGDVVHQFTGAPMANLTVDFDGGSAVTDAAGHFVIAGTSSTSLRALDFSGSSIHNRETFARSSHTFWEVIPSSFNMTAFNDVAREYEPRTIRWMSNPSVYIDTRAHNFPGGGPVPSAWITEIENSVAGFITDWSDGEVSAGSITTGTSPPAEGATGWLIIQFDEDPARYPSPSTVGLARTFWTGNRAITSGAIWLRFEGIGSSTVRVAVFGHELGHTFGMGHMNGSTASLMTPSISEPGLTTFDEQAGDFSYGRSPGNTSPDTDDPSFFVGALMPAGDPVAFYEWVCGDPAFSEPEEKRIPVP